MIAAVVILFDDKGKIEIIEGRFHLLSNGKNTL